MRLVVSVALVGVVAIGAVSGAAARDIDARGPVRALSVTGYDVAYAAEVRPGCFEIRVWDTADRGVRRYASYCFESTSTGSGVAAVTVANGRALWVTYTGGNFREWSLWTRSSTSQPRRIRVVTREVTDPQPIVLGSAWEGSLPYAVDRTIVVLDSSGARRFALAAPERVVSLSAGPRGYAAVLADGRVLTISGGRVLRERAFEPRFVEAAVLAAPGLIVKTRDGLEVHKDASVRRISLPTPSRFHGFAEGLVAYSTGRQLRLRWLTRDQKDVLFRTRATGLRAQLGRLGIASSSGSRVSFNAWVVVTSGPG